MSDPVHPAQLLFTDKHPLTSVLNMKFYPTVGRTLRVDVNAPDSFADQDGVYVHTGFNTLLLDTVTGACAIGELEQMQPIATIKLCCNHLDRPKIGEALTCRATHEGEEHDIAYVRGEIISRDSDKLISSAIATFMIGTTMKSLRDKS